MGECKKTRRTFLWKLFLLMGIAFSNYIAFWIGENDSEIFEGLHGFSSSRFFTFVAVNVIWVLLALMWSFLCRNLTGKRRLSLGVLAFIYAPATLFCVWNLTWDVSLLILLVGIPLTLLFLLIRMETGF